MRQTKILSIVGILMIVFAGACKKDNEPGKRPWVASTDPINEAVDRAINSKISATFNVEMDAATVTVNEFTLKQGTSSVEGTVEYAGTTATFTPSANLSPNLEYVATITSGAKDLVGTSIGNDFEWSFTTGSTSDVSLPTVVSTDPANSAANVVLNHLVSITFSEPMEQTTINPLSFFLKKGTTTVQGEISYTGSTATFTPTSNLEVNAVYTATVTTEAEDMAGNALAANQTFSFTTGNQSDTELPTIVSTSPINNAANVPLNKVVGITFSEAMDQSTISATSFTLKQGNTSIAGSVVYAGLSASFDPSALLQAGLVYTATLSTAAKDLAGNALASNKVWSFTAASSNSPLAMVELGMAGNYVILAKTAINNISTSAITGDLGLSPAATSYITGLSITDATGYATSAQVTGKIYAADMAPPTPINLTTAVENMMTAYTDAAGRPNPDFTELATGNLGGLTLAPGLYKWTTSVSIPSDITISGGANDVWIFQIDGDLGMSSGVHINLTGGAQAKNIFWQLAGEATLGTTSHFEGIILSMTGITFQTGASINGRVLAQSAVIMDANAIVKPQ